MESAVDRVSVWNWAMSYEAGPGIMHWPMPFMSP